MNETKCTCGAKPEHMGWGSYGKWHSQDCPKFDGDHPEICDNIALSHTSCMQEGNNTAGRK